MSTWSKIILKCEYREICDCGENVLCFHPDGNEDLCEPEDCPYFKKEKQNERPKKN